MWSRRTFLSKKRNSNNISTYSFHEHFSSVMSSSYVIRDFFYSLLPPIFSSFLFVFVSICLFVTSLYLALLYGQFVLVLLVTRLQIYHHYGYLIMVNVIITFLQYFYIFPCLNLKLSNSI